MKVKHRAVLGQLGDVDIRLLRVFKAVVDCGGMASAELELNIAMSTISRHIKDLETRVGLVLCRRGRAGFALTPEGQQLYEATQRLLAATEGFRGSLHDIHQRLGGDLHVAVFEKTASNPAAHIPQALALLRERAPQVQLHLHVNGIAVIERGVMDGQFQLGIVPEHRRSDSLDYTPLFDENMLLYAGAGHPWFTAPPARADWRALRQQPLAALGYHSQNMELTHQRRLQRAATASDQEGVALLILSGHYLGFLPEHYAQGFVADGRLRAINPALLRYTCGYSAIVRRSPEALRVTHAFLDCLRELHPIAP